MLRIIHTGRAYEVLEDSDCPGILYTLERLRDMLTTERLHYWKQRTFLEATERQLRTAERKLKSCQKSTAQDQEVLLNTLPSLINNQVRADVRRLTAKDFEDLVEEAWNSLCQREKLEPHDPQDPH